MERNELKNLQTVQMSALERAWYAQPFRGYLMTFALASGGAVLSFITAVFMTNALSWWEAMPFLLITLFLVLLAVQSFSVLHGWRPRIEYVLVERCNKCDGETEEHLTVYPQELYNKNEPRTAVNSHEPGSAQTGERVAITGEAGLLFYKRFHYFLTGTVDSGKCTENYWVKEMGFGAGEFDQFSGWLRDAGITFSKGRGSGTRLLITPGDRAEAMRRIKLYFGFDLERTLEANTPVTVGGRAVDTLSPIPAPAGT